MTISTITINAVDYISYASLVEANNRLAVDPTRSATWAALTDDEKGINLVAATNRLDQLQYAGEKTNGSSQENAFPRTGLVYCDGTATSTTEVPKEVENATILLAGSIAIDNTNSEVGNSSSNIKKVEAGPTAVTFFKATKGVPLQDITAFNLVKCFMPNYITSNSGAYSPGSGADASSSAFSDCTQYNTSNGFY